MSLLNDLLPLGSTSSFTRRELSIATVFAAKTAVAIALCAPFLCSAGPALADALTLTQLNSTVGINATGVDLWSVDGVGQMNQQEFLYRVGSGPGAASTLDTLGTPTFTQAAPSGGTAAYTGGNGLSVKVVYTLTGATYGSGQSGLGELVTLTNSTSSAMTMSLFEYANFALQGSSTGNYVQFQNRNTVDVTTAQNGNALAEKAVTITPNYRDANTASALLSELGSSSLTTLAVSNSSNSPSALFGPGNMAWAYEWDVTIPSNSSRQFSNVLSIAGVVPEPSICVSMLTGLLAVVGLAWRRHK
jgi:hypothetical protein